MSTNSDLARELEALAADPANSARVRKANTLEPRGSLTERKPNIRSQILDLAGGNGDTIDAFIANLEANKKEKEAAPKQQGNALSNILKNMKADNLGSNAGAGNQDKAMNPERKTALLKKLDNTLKFRNALNAGTVRARGGKQQQAKKLNELSFLLGDDELKDTADKKKKKFKDTLDTQTTNTADLEDEKERIKKYMKMPQLIGEENIERLKKQKIELDELRAEILQQEKVKAKLDNQTDILKDHYLQIHDQKEEFKEELTDIKKKNVKLNRKIIDIEFQKDGLMDLLEGKNQKRDPMKLMNPKMRKKLLEDQKKREREMLQRKMAAGVDFLGDTEVKFTQGKRQLNAFRILLDRIGDIIDNLKPFKKNVQKIRANYDKSITLFFEILQQLFVINLFTGVLYAYLIIKHWYLSQDEYEYYFDGPDNGWTGCGYGWPCVYFFSRYKAALADAYVLTNFSFAFAGMAICLYMWIQFDKKAQYQKIFQSDGIIFARRVFNSAMWNTQAFEEQQQIKESGANEMLLLLKEAIIQDEVAKRTPDEWKVIYVRRRVALVITAIILCCGWAIIYAGAAYENELQDWFLVKLHSDFLGQWSSTVIMSGVNYLIPWLVGFVSHLEAWDFAAEELTTELWKNYYTTALNIIFFLYIQLVGSSSAYFSDQPLEEDTEFQCKEDNLTDNMLQLVVSELVLRYTFYLYWQIHHRVRSWLNKDYAYRQDFELVDEFVWAVSINCIFWTALVAYPVLAFLAVPIMYLHTKYLIYRLLHQKRQPLFASNDMSTGSKMLMYLTFTFFIAALFFSLILFIPDPRFHYWNTKTLSIDNSRNCTPFSSNNIESPVEEVRLFPASDSLINRIVFSLLVQFSIYLILYMIGYNSNSHISILNQVKDLKFKEYELKIVELQEKLNKLNLKERLMRQNAYNR